MQEHASRHRTEENCTRIPPATEREPISFHDNDDGGAGTSRKYKWWSKSRRRTVLALFDWKWSIIYWWFFRMLATRQRTYVYAKENIHTNSERQERRLQAKPAKQICLRTITRRSHSRPEYFHFRISAVAQSTLSRTANAINGNRQWKCYNFHQIW